MTTRRYTFRSSHRLHGNNAFAAVFAARARKSAGPISIHALPNELGYPRLGLSVSRRVGNAVRRHHIKRMIREAFRLSQYDWPRGYDLVVVVHPHPAQPKITLAQWQRMLFSTTRSLHQLWDKRLKKLNPPTQMPNNPSA